MAMALYSYDLYSEGQYSEGLYSHGQYSAYIRGQGQGWGPFSTTNPESQTPHRALRATNADKTPRNKPKSKIIPHRITNPTLRFAHSMRASCATNVTKKTQTKQNPKPFLITNPITKPTLRFARHKRDKHPNQMKIKNVDVC